MNKIGALILSLISTINQATIKDDTLNMNGESFLKETNLILAQLKSQDVRPGCTVVLYGKNDCQLLMFYFALTFLNCCIVILDSILEDKQFLEKIEKIAPDIVITADNSKMQLLKSDTSLISNRFFITKMHRSKKVFKEKCVTMMIFSSGTGSEEKLIMLSDDTIITVIKIYLDAIKNKQIHSILNILPLSAIYPLVICVATILSGNKLILSTPQAAIGDLMKNEHIECIPSVPLLVEAIATSIKKRIKDLSILSKVMFQLLISINSLSIRYVGKNLGKILFSKIHKEVGPNLKFILSGGAHINLNTLKFMNNIGFSILEGYGLTEFGGIITMREDDIRQFGTVGKPLSDIVIKIDPASSEILIRSSRKFMGYFNMKHENNEWFASGDRGYFDKNHNLVLSGRLKDIIVRADEKKYLPEQVEKSYEKLRAYADFAICGVKLKHHSGDWVVCFVTPNDKKKREEIKKQFLQQSAECPEFAQINEYNEVASIPKNRLGKICRYKLVEHYLKE